MSEANAEDGLFRQERTKYDRRDETNIVFVFSENKPVFPKTGSDRNPLFHSESDIPALRKTNLELQSGVRALRCEYLEHLRDGRRRSESGSRNFSAEKYP
jgi:hypothetical protein